MAKRKRPDDNTQPPSKPTRKTARKSKPAAPTRITRSMTADASRQAVLNTTELLEGILVHLDPRQLFTIQRVSRQFKATIEGSVEIQRKMYLRLGGEPKEKWLVRGEGTGRQFFPESYEERFVEALPSFTVARANEAVFDPVDGFTNHILSRGVSISVRSKMRGYLMSTVKGKLHSWDHTYVTDSPCTSSRLTMTMTSGARDYCNLTMCVKGTSALTIGTLFRDASVETSDGTYIWSGATLRWKATNQTVQECLLQAERETGKQFRFLGGRAFISAFVLPTDELRREVEMKASLAPSG